MAYERTNWQNGDVISSEKLNKMEAGIEYACSLEHEVEDPTEGQVLKYDAEKGKFVNADAAIETNIQNPTDGQTLKYDAESGKWVNAEGGSGKLVVTINNSGTADEALDRTWQEIADAFPNVAVRQTVTGPGGNSTQFTGIMGVSQADGAEEPYGVIVSDDKQYFTDSPNGYPAVSSL